MNKQEIIKKLIKIANNFDKTGLYQEANILTKIAYEFDDDFEIDENPLDVNMNDLDIEESFDSTKGRVVELRDDKGEGKADLGGPNDPEIVFFSYLPNKEYDVLERQDKSKLGTGDIILLAPPGSLVEGYAALGIYTKYKTKNMFTNSNKILE